MESVVTDLLGKRVTISHRYEGGSPCRLVTGHVRALSSSGASFSLLLQVEEVHQGRGREVGTLAAFVINDYYEVAMSEASP